MKYLSTVILLSCSLATLSTAFADDGKDRCVHGELVDVVTGLSCAGQKTSDTAVGLKNKLMPGITQARLMVKTSGDVFLDEGKKGRDHLVSVGHDLQEPWDFSNLKDEKNQDAAHAMGDVGKAIGKDAKKIGLGFWHGLKNLGGASQGEAITVVDAEAAGFKGREPGDVVTALADTLKGTKNVAIVTIDGVKHVFQRTIGNEFEEKYHSESEKDQIQQEDKKTLHALMTGPEEASEVAIANQGIQTRKPRDRSPAVVGEDLDGSPVPVERPALAAPAVDQHVDRCADLK